MGYSDSSRQPLMWVGAVVAVVLVAAGVLFLAVPSRNVVAAAELPATTSTSSPSTSTSTSTTTSTTTTSTTVKPTTTQPPTTRPTTTRPAAVAAAPKTTPEPPVALPGNTTPAERCANARQWVAEHGLALPAGWGFRCPGSAIVGGEPRWGVACWNCDGTGNWIAVDIGRIGSSDKALRYVIAHETCHAIDYMLLGITTEIGADLCAALHGAPR